GAGCYQRRGSMSIADKLTYLNETKRQLREAINARGATLSTSDTFRSYASALNSAVPVNHIGSPGTMGFGVGICPSPPPGMSYTDGTFAVSSPEYGNYQYSDGS